MAKGKSAAAGGRDKAQTKAVSAAKEAPTDVDSSESEVIAPKRRATAETMATRQREISVSEFFTKNRHLLGFDNPAKSLLTTVKEAVDNPLAPCQKSGLLPKPYVEIVQVQPAT